LKVIAQTGENVAHIDPGKASKPTIIKKHQPSFADAVATAVGARGATVTTSPTSRGGRRGFAARGDRGARQLEALPGRPCLLPGGPWPTARPSRYSLHADALPALLRIIRSLPCPESPPPRRSRPHERTP
jgi:hypothetical protein